MSESRNRALRERIERRDALVVPGAHDCVSARLVERAGFEAVYLTGFGMAASRLGLPDMGFAGLAETADHARNLVDAVSIPVLADADTGYGNELQVHRTVARLEAAGVSAIQLEDQVAPKRCGHLRGHEIVSREDFVAKVRAAVDARRDPDLMVIARTDAVSAVGLDEALERARLAREAGADVLFVEAPRSETDVETIARSFDVPLLYNSVPGGRSPAISLEHLRELRFAIVAVPVDTLLVATAAVERHLRDLRTSGDLAGAARDLSFERLNEILGVSEQLDLSKRLRD